LHNVTVNIDVSLRVTYIKYTALVVAYAMYTVFRQADLQQIWGLMFHGCWPRAVEQPSSWS